MRRVRLVVMMLLMVGMMAGSAVPASAQGYEGWIDHPWPNVGYWWCEWFGEEYWCNAPNLSTGEWGWFRADPGWYLDYD